MAGGWDAAELMLAGADAVQVGTATFADPHAPWKVLHDLDRWRIEHADLDLRRRAAGKEVTT